jgi:hypothetical protein
MGASNTSMSDSAMPPLDLNFIIALFPRSVVIHRSRPVARGPAGCRPLVL